MDRTDHAIAVQRLGKRFVIAHGAPADTMLGVVRQRVRGGLGRGVVGRGRSDHWALRGVSFSVPRGCAMGIVGHNGAGKSTLLKILARLCIPTEGLAEVRGRVGSLLELGAGFHPELTGRENAAVRAVLLGVPRREARRLAEPAAEWAGVAEFLDTPVKHYSSGMRVRLAFGVVAHAAPEILFLDEVLGVGDEAFRQRSTERMAGLIRDGRTVLFVSHSAQAVRSVCERAIRLDHGRLVDEGDAGAVVDKYLRAVRAQERLEAELGGRGPARPVLSAEALAAAGSGAGAGDDA